MIYLLVFLPLIGSIIAGLSSKFISKQKILIISSGLITISAILSMIVFYKVILLKNSYHVMLFNWIGLDNLSINWSIKIDSLSACMLFIITTISSLVHIYSIGYMHDDKSICRFMSYLSLFTFAMIILVVSDNYLQLFFGWEGIGACSYLLIGFWYNKDEANKASMKAFLVNRVSDVFYIIGITIFFYIFHNLNFSFDKISLLKNNIKQENSIFNIICILLFIGSMGKSAQIFFHVWLPDAMEGPTPVSALIHAATLVTAGVFLVARSSPLFEYAPIAREIVTFIGAITCIFAATIAITQNDIKKIIAYSTCSQLGYMFFACGLSAYNAGIFHLLTHAFFKALLFLSAGSVIHALGGEQDIRQMGGLSKEIPKTYYLMLIASITIAGIYPLSGFFSKDMIIESAYVSDSNMGRFAYIIGVLTAFLTSLYSFRLLIMVFIRKKEYIGKHIHESPKTMLYPMYILAIFSITIGMIFVKFGITDASSEFWQDSITINKELIEKSHHLNLLIKIIPLIASISGILLSYYLYHFKPDIADKIKYKLSKIHNVIYNKYYFDEIYDLVFVRSIRNLANLFSIIDVKIIDNMGPNNSVKLTRNLSKYISKLQSGYIYNYAIVIIIGFVLILNWYIFRNY